MRCTLGANRGRQLFKGAPRGAPFPHAPDDTQTFVEGECQASLVGIGCGGPGVVRGGPSSTRRTLRSAWAIRSLKAAAVSALAHYLPATAPYSQAVLAAKQWRADYAAAVSRRTLTPQTTLTVADAATAWLDQIIWSRSRETAGSNSNGALARFASAAADVRGNCEAPRSERPARSGGAPRWAHPTPVFSSSARDAARTRSGSSQRYAAR
jgi:hypothetical protein